VPTHPSTKSDPGALQRWNATGSEEESPLKAKLMSGTPPKPRIFNPPYNVRVTGDHGEVRRERSDGADALGRPCRLAGYGADEAGKTCRLQFAATEHARQLARALRPAQMDEAPACDP